MLCTEANTGKTKADNNIPATVCSFHCLGVPLQPRDKTEYIFFLRPLLLSRITAKSGTRQISTNNVLAIRYVITALGSQTKGDLTFGQTPLAKS